MGASQISNFWPSGSIVETNATITASTPPVTPTTWTTDHLIAVGIVMFVFTVVLICLMATYFNRKLNAELAKVQRVVVHNNGAPAIGSVDQTGLVKEGLQDKLSKGLRAFICCKFNGTSATIFVITAVLLIAGSVILMMIPHTEVKETNMFVRFFGNPFDGVQKFVFYKYLLDMISFENIKYLINNFLTIGVCLVGLFTRIPGALMDKLKKKKKQSSTDDEEEEEKETAVAPVKTVASAPDAGVPVAVAPVAQQAPPSAPPKEEDVYEDAREPPTTGETNSQKWDQLPKFRFPVPIIDGKKIAAGQSESPVSARTRGTKRAKRG